MNKNYRITRLAEENFDQGTRTKAVRTMGGVAKWRYSSCKMEYKQWGAMGKISKIKQHLFRTKPGMMCSNQVLKFKRKQL